jgi:hypothetical protein
MRRYRRQKEHTAEIVANQRERRVPCGGVERNRIHIVSGSHGVDLWVINRGVTPAPTKEQLVSLVRKALAEL